MIDISTEPFCARRLKVLANPTRLAVLRILRAEQFVVAQRDGKAMLYTLAPGVADPKGKGINIGCCVLSF
ncbi:MAG: hypothetical protein RIE73_38425 [Coleofasciculus sp. C1-SOL-03]|uniref:hypothetical protein n=1 Tax=Coleofasciculus sp. C1-SOL-03 TaxID=3069522 RepID=UPI003304E661